MKCRRCAEGGLDLQGRAGGTVVGHSKRYLVSLKGFVVITSVHTT